MTAPVIQVQSQIQIEGPAKALILPTDFVGSFKPADTTPSVKNVVTWVAQNTNPTTVTQFDDGQDGQVLYILGDGYTTVANNANIKNNNSNDTLLQASAVYTYKRMVGIWYQLQGNAGSTPANGVGIKLVDWTFAAHSTVINRAGWTASADLSGAGQTPDKAIDGNLATRWSNGALVTPGTTYWAVDMGVATPTSGVQITQNPGDEVNFPTTGNVQYSDTSATGPWTTIASWTTANIFGTLLIVNWAPATHRYWRMLAESTPAASGNWDSISEINFYKSTWYPSNQTWNSGALTAVWFRGVFAKNATTDILSVGIGYDTSNMYALYYGSSASSILLLKIVAGVQTTLATITVDNDTQPHEFELELITPSGPGQNNWITARIGRTNNPQASAGIQDSALDFTSQTSGIFTMLASTDTGAKGCNYYQLPSTTASDALCTVATGGTITQLGGYRVHIFDTSGTFAITQAGIGTLKLFIVGGGGGSSASNYNGGAGGAIVAAETTLAVGSTTVTVGTGGAIDGYGVSSSFGVVAFAVGGAPAGVAVGGTSGAGSGVAGATGGLAGGAGVGISSGPDGAAAGGGGGGASAVGSDGTVGGPPYFGVAGAGGDGYVNSFGVFGGGGAGGGAKTGTGTFQAKSGNSTGGGGSGEAGIPGTGGGAGGKTASVAGSIGGSGKVIVYYLYDPTKCP